MAQILGVDDGYTFVFLRETFGEGGRTLALSKAWRSVQSAWEKEGRRFRLGKSSGSEVLRP